MIFQRVWVGAVLVAVLLPAAGPMLASGRVDRQTVGIALEGGGALGLAHIGVLRWLEEHRIPVDYVAGTSMGGLVGGVYATGMRPEELKKLVEGIDWDSVLRGQVAYRDLAFRRKQDRRDFQNSLEFGLKKGLALPGGLNSGQEITFIFDDVALPYSRLKSFDDLPIPFRCVAADLTTGKQHVFSDGPLGEALRSTMSLPALFTPVKSGTSLYADGGLLNNLPVDVVKQMGANVVIAVYLDATTEQTGPPSMLSVMGRSIGVMIAANELKSMEMADLLVTVNLRGFTATDYKSSERMIALGYDAAEKKAAMLSRFSVSEDTWQAYLDQRETRRLAPIKEIREVRLEGVPDKLGAEIKSEVDKSVAGEFSTQKLERTLSQLRGYGRFSRFSYSLANTTEPTLLVKAEQYEHAPPFVNIGLNVDGQDSKNVQFALTGRLTVMDLGGYRSEWRTDVTGGSIWALKSEYYKPLMGSRWFVAPRIFLTNTPFDVYSRDTRVAEYRYGEYGGGFDFGYAIGRASEFRVGYETGRINTTRMIGDPVLPEPDGRIGQTSVRYQFDNLDNPILPREGTALVWRGSYYDAMPEAGKGFPLTELSVLTVRRISIPGSVYLQAAGGTTFGNKDTGLPQFLLGGPGRLASYGLNEVRGDDFFLGKLGYLHQLMRLPPLVGDRVYVVSTYEIGKAWGPAFPYKIATDGAVALVAQTFIGPMAIGGSVGNMGHKKWYFQIGRIF